MSIEMIAYDPVQGQVCWLTLREGFSNPTAAFGPGLAEYRPPPKTADSPWVPPTTSEALPIRAVAEPQEPKKETKKQEARTIPLDGRAEIIDRRSISSGRLSLVTGGTSPTGSRQNSSQLPRRKGKCSARRVWRFDSLFEGREAHDAEPPAGLWRRWLRDR
jgi:hypothetical protein